MAIECSCDPRLGQTAHVAEQIDGADYGDSKRTEMMGFVPTVATTVLDIGCWRGSFGATLKRERSGTIVWGVEARADIADEASARLDRVLVGAYPEVLQAEAPLERFDCITLLDVLEHLVDPWSALRTARSHLNPSGTVVASIPNVRNVQVVVQLLRGRWDYVDAGILDRTHLRFFTRRSIVEMFESTGFKIDRIEPINLIDKGRLARTLAVFGRRAWDFRALQFAVVASSRP